MMQVYLAPLEGITGFVYRNAFAKYFRGLDKYFMPFLNPKSYGYLSAREKEELAVENNQGLNVVPQILTNDAEDFLKVAQRLQDLGYNEVNFNLGCPSRPVVNKGRGAGFLLYPKQLDEFLMEVFEKCNMNISIKTRIGMESPDEFAKLLDIYNKYPITELIVHPRVGEDFYGNQPNWEAFGEALSGSRAPVCYNGDIFTKDNYNALTGAFGTLKKIMIGRGLLSNPFLLEEIVKDKPKKEMTDKSDIKVDGIQATIVDEFISDEKRFWAFHDEILKNYQRVIPINMEKIVLSKMKELWDYMIDNFADSSAWKRRINETRTISDYQKVIWDMVRSGLYEN